MWRLANLLRMEFGEAKSDQEGLIFSYVRAFDHQDGWDYVEKICH